MSEQSFTPDYRNFEAVMHNRRSDRLTLYEHIIQPQSMVQIFDGPDNGLRHSKNEADVDEFFRQFCKFFKEMTYDVVSYEECINTFFPSISSICGGVGPIQTRADFESYPWEEITIGYRDAGFKRFNSFVKALPPGMKAVGGVGNGLFELAESLVGLEHLPYMQVDNPELYAALFVKIGDIMYELWNDFLKRYGSYFIACRFGDDLGFRTSILTNPTTVYDHIFPQYKRVIDCIHAVGNKFLWHSCGCIFEVMDGAIAVGVDAKHSNEDAIAPFDTWIKKYGDRIGLVGGFDLDILCTKTESEVYDIVLREGRRYREMANGYALGSGNSIPPYVPPANYLAMIRAAQEIRRTD